MGLDVNVYGCEKVLSIRNDWDVLHVLRKFAYNAASDVLFDDFVMHRYELEQCLKESTNEEVSNTISQLLITRPDDPLFVISYSY